MKQLQHNYGSKKKIIVSTPDMQLFKSSFTLNCTIYSKDKKGWKIYSKKGGSD